MARLYTVNNKFYWDEALQMWQPNPLDEPNPLCWDVCQVIRPDRDGFSDWFNVAHLKELLPMHAGQIGGNGSNLFTRSHLAKAFNFEPEQAYKTRGTAKVERRAYGLVKARSEQFPIRKDIKEAIRKRYCAVLHTKAQIEVDHKDGRKDSWLTNDVNLQRIDDFQALHKTANNVKRQVCKDCDSNNQRFDARVLGFPCGWTEGGAQYHGTCRGCFWYDPVAFRSALASPKAV